MEIFSKSFLSITIVFAASQGCKSRNFNSNTRSANSTSGDAAAQSSLKSAADIDPALVSTTNLFGDKSTKWVPCTITVKDEKITIDGKESEGAVGRVRARITIDPATPILVIANGTHVFVEAKKSDESLNAFPITDKDSKTVWENAVRVGFVGWVSLKNLACSHAGTDVADCNKPGFNLVVKDSAPLKAQGVGSRGDIVGTPFLEEPNASAAVSGVVVNAAFVNLIEVKKDEGFAKIAVSLATIDANNCPAFHN